jgi:hypothetical protein
MARRCMDLTKLPEKFHSTVGKFFNRIVFDPQLYSKF